MKTISAQPKNVVPAISEIFRAHEGPHEVDEEGGAHEGAEDEVEHAAAQILSQSAA